MGKAVKLPRILRKVLVPVSWKPLSPQTQGIPSSREAEGKPIPARLEALYEDEESNNFVVKRWNSTAQIKEIYQKILVNLDGGKIDSGESVVRNGFLQLKANIVGFPTECEKKEEFIKEMVEEETVKLEWKILSQLVEKVSSIKFPWSHKLDDNDIALRISNSITKYSDYDMLLLKMEKLKIIQQEQLLKTPPMSLDDIRSRKPITKPSFCKYICSMNCPTHCSQHNGTSSPDEKRVTKGSGKTVPKFRIVVTKRRRQQLIRGKTANAGTPSAAPNPKPVGGRRKKRKANRKMPRKSRLHSQMDKLTAQGLYFRKYEPCRHPGVPCDEQCTCFLNGTYCEKFCGCNKSCTFRYKGCNCLDGQCYTNRCACYRRHRECDPEVCGRCGAETFDCHNMPMQLGQSKSVVVKPSTVHGNGLFAAQSIDQGDFVMEMIGEIISYEESHRREGLYNTVEHTFLMELSSKEVLDCARAGNEARFLNSSTNPNLIHYPIFVNGYYRVAIYALCPIDSGTELLINYEDIIRKNCEQTEGHIVIKNVI